MHSTEWPADEPLRTEIEQDANPYPDNLELMCVGSYTVDSRTGGHVWAPVLRASHRRVPCQVLERHEPIKEGVMPKYRVEMVVGTDDETNKDETLIVDQVPHEWVFLTDRVKSADWHMPNTFRHPIMIPDEIFPDIWKNKLTGDGLQTSNRAIFKAVKLPTGTVNTDAPVGVKISGAAPAGARAAALGGMEEL